MNPNSILHIDTRWKYYEIKGCLKEYVTLTFSSFFNSLFSLTIANILKVYYLLIDINWRFQCWFYSRLLRKNEIIEEKILIGTSKYCKHFPIWNNKNFLYLRVILHNCELLISISLDLLRNLFFHLNVILHRFDSHYVYIFNYIYINIYNINVYPDLRGFGVY